MKARDLRARLDGVRGAEDKFTARCPAHDDQEASLSIRDADDKVLLKCFAGCTVEAIAHTLGLDVRDLRHEPDTSSAGPRPARPERVTVAALAKAKRLPVAFLTDRFKLRNDGDGVAIPYFDEAGREVLVKRRVALAAKAGSRWPAGAKLMPYGLEDLPTARARGYVVLVEGESDRWVLAFHDFAALGLPGATAGRCLAREHLEGIPKVFLVQEADDAGAGFVESLGQRIAPWGPRDLRVLPFGGMPR